MKYDFSAQFLLIRPPDTSFGQAWESLCYALLDAELNDPTLMRLKPPDKGVDILHRSVYRAYQCKSDERGAFGSLGAAASVKSLESAYKERESLNWSMYCFASNASYTGSAFTTIVNRAKELGLRDDQIEFSGPEHWDKLCEKHSNKISELFDYRISISKERVDKAFKNQRYFQRKIDEYKSSIDEADLVIKVRNNRTPVVLEIPFSPDLTIEHCVDVVKDLLGVSLEWTNYHDLGTSAGPSISLAIGRTPQDFSQKIKDLPIEPGGELQFWITIVWRDKRRDDAADVGTHKLYYRFNLQTVFMETDRDSITYTERKRRTIERSEELLETMIWNSARNLKGDSNTA